MTKRKQTRHGLSSDWHVVEWRPRRKGPAPGTVDRYRDADRKLYPELKQLAEKCGSVTAAARQLAERGKVAGTGTNESRARRLGTRYLNGIKNSRWQAG